MDVISNLPDELLLRVISLLSTKEAISTSVLSKRWEKVWVNLQNLDFRIESRSATHVANIDRILDRLQSSEIARFHLDSNQKLPPGVIAKWISNSVRLNVCKINFCVPSMELPSTLFSSASLTHLKLCSSFSGSITVPEDFFFPNVKSLVFKVSGPPKELTEKLFRNWPKLEKLELGGMRYYKGQGYYKDKLYDISCWSLRVLDISFWEHRTNATAPIIFLDAPKLESIDIEEKFGVEFVVQGSCAPVEATICLLSCCHDLLSEEDGNHAFTILRGISGVKSLTVDESMIYNWFERRSGYFWMRCDFKAMEYLLSNAKVLKKVTASPHRIGLREEVVFWTSLEHYTKTLLPCRYAVPPEDHE